MSASHPLLDYYARHRTQIVQTVIASLREAGMAYATVVPEPILSEVLDQRFTSLFTAIATRQIGLVMQGQPERMAKLRAHGATDAEVLDATPMVEVHLQRVIQDAYAHDPQEAKRLQERMIHYMAMLKAGQVHFILSEPPSSEK